MTASLTAGELEIDLAAIAANWRSIEARTAGADVAAMVKADAYGLGATDVAPVLAAAGCREFFVADLGEAVALRGLLPDVEIFVLTGALRGTEADLEAHRLVPVLISGAQIERWAARARARGTQLPASVHLDTGMHRAGLDTADTAALLADPSVLDSFDVRHVMSHLASADDPESGLLVRGVERHGGYIGDSRGPLKERGSPPRPPPIPGGSRSSRLRAARRGPAPGGARAPSP